MAVSSAELVVAEEGFQVIYLRKNALLQVKILHSIPYLGEIKYYQQNGYEKCTQQWSLSVQYCCIIVCWAHFNNFICCFIYSNPSACVLNVLWEPRISKKCHQLRKTGLLSASWRCIFQPIQEGLCAWRRRIFSTCQGTFILQFLRKKYKISTHRDRCFSNTVELKVQYLPLGWVELHKMENTWILVAWISI